MKARLLPHAAAAAPRQSWLLTSRWPLFSARALTLAGFLLTILAGLFGSPVGSHNFAIIFVWIAWWTALKLGFIPLGGRAWCAICPLPMPGEWLAQGSIFPTGKRCGPRLAWPRKIGPLRLDRTWLQSGGFLLVGLFAAVTLTTPRLTGGVLLGLLLLATILPLVFREQGSAQLAGAGSRVFCNHLCPIGGFTGLYAQAAPLELRVRDLRACAAHGEKTCLEHCPWGVYIPAARDNSPCGLCLECLRVCPQENVSLNLRRFGQDFRQPHNRLRLDEAFLALVMLGCALVFAAVFLGPWGALRVAAYSAGSPAWGLYAAGFLLFTGLLLPGLFALMARLGGALTGGWRKALPRFARPLLPLGLAGWIAFTIAFAFAKLNYVLPVLADPFGRGWNLLGLGQSAFNLDGTYLSPLLQAAVLLGGMLWTGSLARQDADTPRRALALQGFALLFTLGMLALLIG